MKIESLKPGMVVYDVHTYRMGNTTMRTMGVWNVHIVSVDLEHQSVTASWNTNPPQKFYKRKWSKWRLKKPLLIKYAWGAHRLANKAEVKAHEARKAADQHAAAVVAQALTDPMGAME